MNKPKKALWWAFPALLMLALTACNGAPKSFQTYQETIAQFQAATDNTSAATLEYVRTLNKFERDYEFRLLREDPKRKLDARKLIKGNFTPEAIQVRVQTFAVLRGYTGMLSKLAESDASERWKASTERLKSSTDGLLGTLGQSGIAPKLQGLPISALSGPLKSLADAIAGEIIVRQRAAALDAAIAKAAPAINEIAALLRRDVQTVVRQRDSVSLIDISQLSSDYAMAQQANNESERLRKLEQFRTTLDAREAQLAELSALGRAIDGFNSAHDALVAYAKSDKGPSSLSDLVAAVAGYAGVAKEVLDAVRVVSKGSG